MVNIGGWPTTDQPSTDHLLTTKDPFVAWLISCKTVDFTVKRTSALTTYGKNKYTENETQHMIRCLHQQKSLYLSCVYGAECKFVISPSTDHLLTDHLPTTYQPPTDHLPTTYQPLPTTYQPSTDHLPTTYQPPTDHLLTTYQPLTDHLLTTYQPSTNHLLTTYKPPTDHLPTTYRPPSYQPLTNHLPTIY